MGKPARQPATRSIRHPPARRIHPVVYRTPWHLVVPAVALPAVAPPAPALAQPPDPLPVQAAQDAYLDETARRLVSGASHARDTARAAVGSYAALIRERMAFAAPGHRRDRQWASAERAARVRWSAGEPGEVRLVDERFRNPGFGGNGFPGFFREPGVERFAADLFGDPFLFGLGPPFGGGALGADAISVQDPLGEDAERYYEFRSGDTTLIRLDSGRDVEAVAVTVIPRYRNIRLVAAILWIDPSSMALVRVAYRPAKRADSEMGRRLLHHGEWGPLIWIKGGSGAPGDDPAKGSLDLLALPVNLPFWGFVGKVEMDLSAVIVDFEPGEGGGWLPRSARWKGHFGKDLISATLRPPAGIPFTVDWTVDIEALRAPGERLPPVPANPEAVAGGDLLPPPVRRDTASAGQDDAAVAAELAAIGIGPGGDAMENANPWFFRIPGTAVGLMRYNPVEGYSVGGAARRDFGWWRSELTVRAATGSLDLPDMELALQHDHPRRTTRFSVYRTLRRGAVGVGARAGLPGYYAGSADSAAFHWSHGAAIRFTPGGGRRAFFSLNIFAERDDSTGTGGERTRVGGGVEWKPWWDGFGDGSAGVGTNVIVRGSTGDYSHIKAMVEGALVVPLVWRFSLGAKAGTARVWGDPLPQDLWRIAGNGSWVRGHKDEVETRRTWMGRVDLQRSLGIWRLSVYADRASNEDADYCAVGAGLVLMDGLFRLDLARGVDCGREGSSEAGWRLHPRAFTFF